MLDLSRYAAWHPDVDDATARTALRVWAVAAGCTCRHGPTIRLAVVDGDLRARIMHRRPCPLPALARRPT